MTPSCTVGGIRIRFSLLFPAMLALLCSNQQGAMTARCLLAAVMHECGHLLMLLLLGSKPREIRFSAFGMCLQLADSPLSQGKHLLVSLGGPLVNLLTAGLLWLLHGNADWMAIHLLLGGFNLLPIYPLDGGQCLPEGRGRTLVSAIFLAILSLLSLVLTVYGNISLSVVCLYLWFHQGKG